MARLVYSPRLVMDDYAGEDLLRRQAVVSVDDDGRVADAESFAEVVVFARDVLRELYDVLVVGHWDIDAILAAAYEEVALHVVASPCLWFVACIIRIKKDGADNTEARPGGVCSDETQLRRRKGCVEFMAFSRSRPRHCPETPQGSERMSVPKFPKAKSRA